MKAEDYHARLHDEIAAQHIDGIDIKELNQQIIERMTAAIAAGEVEPIGVEAFVQSRSNSLKRQRNTLIEEELPTILDAINDETALGQEDPILDLAVAVGDEGKRKLIRYLSWDDWEAIKRAALDNAAKAAASANAKRVRIEGIQDAMKSAGVLVTEDLPVFQ